MKEIRSFFSCCGIYFSEWCYYTGMRTMEKKKEKVRTASSVFILRFFCSLSFIRSFSLNVVFLFEFFTPASTCSFLVWPRCSRLELIRYHFYWHKCQLWNRIQIGFFLIQPHEWMRSWQTCYSWLFHNGMFFQKEYNYLLFAPCIDIFISMYFSMSLFITAECVVIVDRKK